MSERAGSSREPGRTRAREGRLRGGIALLAQHPQFRRLYLARTASLLGDWFNLLAILALVRALGATGAAPVGIVLILKLLPATLVGPVAGVVADRFPRRAIMIASDASRFLLVVSLQLAPLLELETALGFVYAVTALQVTGQAFSEPARLASIPNVVPRGALATANVLAAFTWSVMFTLGAGLGGVVTSLLGWRFALLIDALTYLISIALMLGVRLPPPPVHPGGLDLWTLTGLRDAGRALAFLRRRAAVAVLLSAKAGWGLAGGITLVLTLYGERVLTFAGRPALGIGVLYMARGIGTALGPVLARRLSGDRITSMRRAITVSFALSTVCYVAFARAERPFTAIALVILAHLGGSTVWVFSTVLLQKTVPDRFRGRVFALEMALATGTLSVATWLTAELFDRGLVGLRELPLTVAAALLVAGAAWVLLTRPRRRHASRPQSDVD